MNLQAYNNEEFEAACLHIVREWERSHVDGSQAHWLERSAYELLGGILDRGDLEVWKAREALLDRRGAKGSLNLFRYGLRLIFAHKPGGLDPRARELMGRRLLYAYRHFVPPPFLKSFLDAAPRRPSATEIAPEFEIWTAYMTRWSGCERSLCGPFPLSIGERARKLRKQEFSMFADAEWDDSIWDRAGNEDWEDQP